jgi:hypothetical protein
MLGLPRALHRLSCARFKFILRFHRDRATPARLRLAMEFYDDSEDARPVENVSEQDRGSVVSASTY